MKRLLKYTTLILMVMLLSGSAWAYNYTDHVTTAPNNKGDVLIFPWFLAIDGGWQTKLTVINTSETNSVVAKLIIRSFKNSEELLDFFLYLSPADVWTGVIRYDGTLGRNVIYSDDDSALSSLVPSLVWANVTPINVPFFPLSCSDDNDFLGYVEVITAAAGVVTPGAPGVSKATIYSEYAKLIAGTTSTLKLAGDYAQGTRINTLAGYMQFMNPAAGLDASLRATTLKDYANLELMTTGSETRLGATAQNKLIEVEASLTKDDIALPYVNGDDIALHMFTFPTKLTKVTDCKVSGADSPFFTRLSASAYCVPYTVITYDLMENHPGTGTPFSGGGSETNKLCYEVNFLGAPSFEYAEGWAHYAMDASVAAIVTAGTTKSGAALTYDGMPIIPTYFYIGVGGLSANYGAWTDELVYGACQVGTGTLPDYQYTDSAAISCPAV